MISCFVLSVYLDGEIGAVAMRCKPTWKKNGARAIDHKRNLVSRIERLYLREVYPGQFFSDR